MSYRQFCGLARALDVVGDKWTLLIVRELLVGAARYGDLRRGLPGIPSNLLADRLRRLVEDGVVEKADASYALAPRGQELRGAVEELVRWSEPLMARGRGEDAFQPNWLVPALRALLEPRKGGRLNLKIDDGALHVVTDGVTTNVATGSVPGSDATLDTDPETLLGIVTGHLRLRDSLRRGTATLDGSYPLVVAMLGGRRS